MLRPLSEKSIRSLVTVYTAVSHAKEFNQLCNHVLMLIYVICAQFNGLCDLFIDLMQLPHIIKRKTESGRNPDTTLPF